MPIKRLKLSLLVGNAGTQIRNSIDPGTVEEYSQEIKNGAKFPPLTVFYDVKSDIYYLADGFHRYTAFKRRGIKEYICDVQVGDRISAIKFALGTNTRHGLRRKNVDKRNAVKIALKEFTSLSDGAIAILCCVTQPFVSKIKRSQVITVMTSKPQNIGNSAKNICPARRVTGADGKSYSAAKEKPKPEEKKQRKDETKLPIPPEILEDWEKATIESNDALTMASSLRNILRDAQKDNNKTFSEVDFTDNIAKLDTIYTDLKRSRPYAVCFKCNGVNQKNCNDCKKRGWISEHFYKFCVPEETKKITKR